MTVREPWFEDRCPGCGGDGAVLDPFAGSGSTLVAAKREHRRAIGIEIEERWCEVAASRCSQNSIPLTYPAARIGRYREVES